MSTEWRALRLPPVDIVGNLDCSESCISGLDATSVAVGAGGETAGLLTPTPPLFFRFRSLTLPPFPLLLSRRLTDELEWCRPLELDFTPRLLLATAVAARIQSDASCPRFGGPEVRFGVEPPMPATEEDVLGDAVAALDRDAISSSLCLASLGN